jgi:K+ transporter
MSSEVAPVPPALETGTDRHTGARAALALGALGVVFGDLGTSPL